MTAPLEFETDAGILAGNTPGYPTLDQVPDLTASQMLNARALSFSPLGNETSRWDARAEVYGSSVSGLLPPLHRFDGVAGATYKIQSTSLFDPVSLRVYDRDGNAIVVNEESDDPPASLRSDGTYNTDVIHDWVAPYTGAYYVDASWNQGAFYRDHALILDVDYDSIPRPVISIFGSAQSKPEGDSGSTPFIIQISRTGDTSSASSAAWSVSSALASAADFAGGVLPSGIVSFAAGETSKTITVQVAGDTASEPDEAFTVTLLSPSNATLGTAAVNAMIVNDDGFPSLSITSPNANQPEGNRGTTNLIFTVTRTGDTSVSSSASWAVTSATATADDFVNGVLPSGTVSFAAGETSRIITVAVAGDSSLEPDEAFIVTLLAPSNAVLGTTTASGTILNDDSALIPGIVVNGTAGNDPALAGGAGHDTINGLAGQDTLIGFGGDDRLDGGTGALTDRDLAVYTGPIAGYALARSGAILTIADGTPGRDGTDTTTNLERLKFSDVGVNLTVQAAAASIGQAALDRICELYLGFFARVPAADGLETWINQFEAGRSLAAIADDFYRVGSSEALRSVTGYWDFESGRALSDRDFVTIAYRNVLGREGLESGIDYWVSRLGGDEALTRGELVSTMLDAAQGLVGHATWGWVAALLEDKVEMSKRIAIDWGLNYGADAAQTVAKGVAIANSVTTEPNPVFPSSPIKHFDFDAATALIGVNPANIDLVA